MLDFSRYQVLTFDCYGTLIDWESGILDAMRPILQHHGMFLTDPEILEQYVALEPKLQQGVYRPYKDILNDVVAGFGSRYVFDPGDDELSALIHSIPHWQPFPDTVDALHCLQKYFKLAILSNIDNDLFAATQKHLKTDFDWVMTAETIGSYKPSLNNFHFALEHIGLPASEVLHVAQSLHHDIVPAQKLGLSTVWVNRRSKQTGSGATPQAVAQPDIEVPDLVSLARLVEKAKEVEQQASPQRS